MLTRQLAILGSVVALAASIGNAKGAEQLSIGVYGGQWLETLKEGAIADFEKKTGAKVVTEVGWDNVFVTKLRAGGGKTPAYDLVILQPNSLATLAGAKLVQPIDSTKIANWSDVSKTLVDQLTIDGKQYAAPFLVGQLVLAYNPEKTKKAPTSWLDLFDPEYQSCGVALWPPNTAGGGAEMLSGLTKAVGSKLSDPNAVEKVFALIDGAKKSVKGFPTSTGDLATLFQRGDVCVAPQWDGRIIAQKIAGIPIQMVQPKEGGVAALNGFAIATGSANTELAYKFLNSVLDPDTQAIFGNQIFYGMSNTKTRYNDRYTSNRPAAAPYETLVWPDYDAMLRNSTDWQKRWETIFRQ